MVRDLLGAVTRNRAMKGILITTGTFTREARRFAEEAPLTLIDGKELRELLLRYGLLATDPIPTEPRVEVELDGSPPRAGSLTPE
jgi:restriction endonuclease Mrr